MHMHICMHQRDSWCQFQSAMHIQIWFMQMANAASTNKWGLGAKGQCVRGNWRYVALRGELCSLSQCLHGPLWNSPAVPLEPQISHLSYGMLFTRTLAYFLIRIKEQRKLFPMPKGHLCTWRFGHSSRHLTGWFFCPTAWNHSPSADTWPEWP